MDPSTRAVLVTGCDTGFGHALAKHLHEQGIISILTNSFICLMTDWLFRFRCLRRLFDKASRKRRRSRARQRGCFDGPLVHRPAQCHIRRSNRSCRRGCQEQASISHKSIPFALAYLPNNMYVNFALSRVCGPS